MLFRFLPCRPATRVDARDGSHWEGHCGYPVAVVKPWLKYAGVAIVGGAVGGTLARWPAPRPQVIEVPVLLREGENGQLIWQSSYVEDPLEARLDARVGPLSLGYLPLNLAIASLFEHSELDGVHEKPAVPTIKFDMPALLEAGVAPDKSVLVDVESQSTIRTVLDKMLASASEGAALVAEPQSGALLITTMTRLSDFTTTRIYAVADLLVEMAAVKKLVDARIDPNAQAPHASDLEMQIVYLVQEVRYDTWRANGGSIGAMSLMGGNLVVTHTPSVHRQIERLLAALRAAVFQQRRMLEALERSRAAEPPASTIDPLAPIDLP